MADTLNDSSVVAGSRQITISAVTYDCTNWTWEDNDVEFIRKGINGEVTGRKYVNSKDQTATAVAQLPTTSAAIPPLRTTFTTTDIDGTSITAYIVKRGKAETNAGETTVPITVKKAIGSVVTS